MLIYLFGALWYLGAVQAYFLIKSREPMLVHHARAEWQSLAMVVFICTTWPIGAVLDMRRLSRNWED